METISWREKQESPTVVFQELWEMYKGSWPMTQEHENWDTPYLQRMEMLQEIIRREMRATHDRYLAGKATQGCVSEIRGHAILLGKMIAEYKHKAA